MLYALRVWKPVTKLHEGEEANLTVDIKAMRVNLDSLLATWFGVHDYRIVNGHIEAQKWVERQRRTTLRFTQK